MGPSSRAQPDSSQGSSGLTPPRVPSPDARSLAALGMRDGLHDNPSDHNALPNGPCDVGLPDGPCDALPMAPLAIEGPTALLSTFGLSSAPREPPAPLFLGNGSQ
jgi:hypothetical protein